MTLLLLFSPPSSPPSTLPAATVQPVLTGPPYVGETAVCSTGTWTNSPTSFAYQWQRDQRGDSVFADIAGATTNTRTFVRADAHNLLRCVVTATNSSGDGTRPSVSMLIYTGRTRLDVIFSRHPASVLGTGNNPDLLINGPEAV